MSGAITEYPVPTPLSAPFIITPGPDGNVWFVESDPQHSQVGRVTPNGTITEFAAGITPHSIPSGIAAGADGNLWFTEGVGKIGRITPKGTVTEFSAPTALDHPYNITAGSDGNLWFTAGTTGRIGRVVP
ncbi:MAG: hypothetical protein JO024_02130 [Candidatus Eremiobacteraeota bacterium]|nr:hypothetical protein [Candidatus Eremiobacteraeota bacterium]